MDELSHNLADHRRRIRRVRAADAAMRAAFYASIVGCVALAISKFAGVALPIAPLAGVLAAAPAALAIREWTRSFSLRDCAIHLDRLLGLDERLSTAVEAGGPMESAVKADAAAAIGRSPLPPRRYPREAGLLIGTLVLAATLAVLPSPERSGSRGDPALQEVSAEQASRIQSMTGLDVQFQEVKEEAARALRENRPEQALALMEELRRRLEEQLLNGDGANVEALQKALDRLAAGGAAVSAELARLGRIVHAPPPAVARAKLERQKSAAGPSAPAAAATADAGSSLGAVLVQDVPWSLRYEPVVRRYRGY